MGLENITQYNKWNGEASLPCNVLEIIDVIQANGSQANNITTGNIHREFWAKDLPRSTIIGWRLTSEREEFLKNKPLNSEDIDIKKQDWHLKEMANFKKTPVKDYVVAYDDDGEVCITYTDTDRFTDPLYKDIPLEVHELCMKHGHTINWEHFIHQGLSDKTLVSYIENASKDRKQKTTTCKIGRYLKKFSGMTDPQVAKVAALYRVKIVGDLGIKFARTREEIKAVYINGPSSCMSHSISYYSTDGIHPCEIYATPDISVAYVERDGRITGRTVCNEVDKSWVNIYGDSTLLQEGLELLGYTPGDLEGCSLLLLKNTNGDVIAPYLDGDDGIDLQSDKLVVSSGDYNASRQDGLLYLEGKYCDHCDTNGHNEDDMYYSDYHEISICEGCIENYYLAWHGSDQMYINGNDVTIYEYNGDYYTDEGLDYADLVETEDGDIIHSDDSVWSDMDGETYEKDDDDLLWYTDKYSSQCATKHNHDQIVQAEDSGEMYEAGDCYEYNDLYYADEDNMMEAKLEDEKTTEVA